MYGISSLFMNQMTGVQLLDWDDFPAYYDIYAAEMTEIFGAFLTGSEELKGEWRLPHFAPGRDVVGIYDASGRLAAYAEVRVFRYPPVRPSVYGYVRRECRGRGYGSRLLDWALGRAASYVSEIPEDARLVLQGFAERTESRELFLGHDFVNTRESWIMKISFEQAPEPPRLPEGLTFARMSEGTTLEDIARLHLGTFRDHRGFQEEPLADVAERWKKILESESSFMPELATVVKDGERDVAMVVVLPQTEEDHDRGYVQILGVMPDYRRRGIGLELLRFAFSELYKLGKNGCDLSVDASSLTNATALYERAGMHRSKVFSVYEKEIRPGREYTNQG